MSRRLPPLNALKAFDSVARLGSVRRAAAELSVSHTVVGRHVRNLESWLGVLLISVSSSGAELTPEGRQFHRSISAGFRLFEHATAELRPDPGYSEVRIWCVPGVATRWLMPRLKSLAAELRNREIILRPMLGIPDFARREADLAIVYDCEAPPTVRSQDLGRPRVFPVASPEFLARRGPIRSLQDLLGQPLIHEESREQWRIWLQMAGMADVPPLSGIRLWQADVVADAAIMGQGIALSNSAVAGDAIRDGRLVELLDTEVRMGVYSFQSLEERWNDPVVVRARRWTTEAFAEQEAASRPAFDAHIAFQSAAPGLGLVAVGAA